MRLRTIGLIGILVLGLLVGPLPAEAQQPGKVYRIGFVAPWERGLRFLKEGLAELGYTEGQNIAIVVRSGGHSLERLTKVMPELVDFEVDVIVVETSTAARIAKKVTATIPIVVVAGADLVRTGLVASLARPGGNVTGFTTFDPELAGKRLELLKEAFPTVSRVGVIWNSDSATGMPIFRQIEAAAQRLGESFIPWRCELLSCPRDAPSYTLGPPAQTLTGHSKPQLRGVWLLSWLWRARSLFPSRTIF